MKRHVNGWETIARYLKLRGKQQQDLARLLPYYAACDFAGEERLLSAQPRSTGDDY